MAAPLTFLVASPHLRGELFEGTVILLLEHDQKGATGLIVNTPTTQRVSELMANAEGQSQTAWVGGPVEPSLGWCLYSRPLGLQGEVLLVDGLYVTSSLDALQTIMASGQQYMLILGYSGWSSGQLTAEAREGVWLWVEQDNPDLIWKVPHEERWGEAVRRLGVNPKTIVAGGAQA